MPVQGVRKATCPCPVTRILYLRLSKRCLCSSAYNCQTETCLESEPAASQVQLSSGEHVRHRTFSHLQPVCVCLDVQSSNIATPCCRADNLAGTRHPQSTPVSLCRPPSFRSQQTPHTLLLAGAQRAPRPATSPHTCSPPVPARYHHTNHPNHQQQRQLHMGPPRVPQPQVSSTSSHHTTPLHQPPPARLITKPLLIPTTPTHSAAVQTPVPKYPTQLQTEPTAVQLTQGLRAGRQATRK